MTNNPLPRLDKGSEIYKSLLPHCRLTPGNVWCDLTSGHKVGCLDAAAPRDIAKLTEGYKATLAVHDPPYNLVAFEEQNVNEFIRWSKKWVQNTVDCLDANASVYIWLGADQKNGFQPLPDFMIMMRSLPLTTRSFITMRNQRGYGTQQNWMAVRQELLYYTRGKADFNIDAEYTDIPKILRGYYKKVGSVTTENMERSKSENIRAGNVWVDIQQVFYRMDENVSGCYAQKPLKCIDRIVRASSSEGETILDFFAHSGTTLLSCERLKRRCLTIDIDPVFCEITIRRLENYRKTGRLGWQNGHAFENDIHTQFEPMSGESLDDETLKIVPATRKRGRPPKDAPPSFKTLFLAMEKLKHELDRLIALLSNEADFRKKLVGLFSVYPFNDFEYIISTLLGQDVLSLDDYYAMRDSYMDRNIFLYIFEISGPRTFGEAWAQGNLKELIPELHKPSKKSDPNYSGEYDFYLDGKIRIEVKASRVVDSESDEPLYVKALASDSPKPFWMNFQQVKPACCDVFVWIAVWRDRIGYWVLSSHELAHHRDYSAGQHRGNTGEGQLHVRQDNIKDFKPFEAASNNLGRAIRDAYGREIAARKKKIRKYVLYAKKLKINESK